MKSKNKVEKNIKIDKKTWLKLSQIKLKNDMIRIADVIQMLLKEYTQKSKK